MTYVRQDAIFPGRSVSLGQATTDFVSIVRIMKINNQAYILIPREKDGT
jgi:hypothetical protein